MASQHVIAAVEMMVSQHVIAAVEMMATRNDGDIVARIAAVGMMAWPPRL
jgi:hypothetical protein